MNLWKVTSGIKSTYIYIQFQNLLLHIRLKMHEYRVGKCSTLEANCKRAREVQGQMSLCNSSIQ